jgi:hypothetical protein
MTGRGVAHQDVRIDLEAGEDGGIAGKTRWTRVALES